VAVRDLGSLGPAEGPPISVPCALSDSLRSVYLWFVLGGLLLLRRANRTKAAWAVVLPLLAVYGILHVVEGTVNSHSLWSVTPFLCSLGCEMLRSLALGLAVLLTLSDRIKVRSRVLRAALTFVVLVVAGSAAVVLNAPLSSVRSARPTLFLSPVNWSIVFGVVVLTFMIGQSIISAVLRRLTGARALPWCARVCFALGAASILVLVGTKLLIVEARLMSNQQSLFAAGALLGSLLGPYLVFFWFVLLALRSPFYRQRFANCFGGARRLS
jgi:hypothetical protein